MSLKNWFSEISEKKIRDKQPVGVIYNYWINWILRKFLETNPEKNELKLTGASEKWNPSQLYSINF